MTRDLKLFLILEAIAILLAASLFSLLESRLMAGLVAGGYFLLSGLFMIARARKWPDKWIYPTWSLLLIHVFLISIPMLAVRLLNVGVPFDQLTIFGLPGPLFHRASSVIFVSLIISTGLDWIRVARGQKAAS